MNEKQQKKDLKLGNWGIVDGALMREILDDYLLNPDFSGKVLELQRLRSIVHKPRIRAFIGQGLKMKDYPLWNHNQIESLRRLRDNIKLMKGIDDIPDFTDSISALCLWEDGPRITPICNKESLEGEDNFLTSRIYQDMFGETILSDSEKSYLKKEEINLELSFWLHITKEGKFRLPALNTSLEPKFRVRAMDLDTWREITSDYIDRGCVCPEYVEAEDIPLSQIEL